MAGQTAHFEVIICGAGLAGIATAYYLAQQGITDILLLDKRPPMTFTSDKSGSNYRNWWPHPAMAALANHSIDLMDDIAAAQGNFFRLNRQGYTYFSTQPDLALLAHYQHESIGEIRLHNSTKNSYQPKAHAQADGADVLTESALLQTHFPFLRETVQTGIHVRRAGWLSTRVLAMHLLDEASSRGVLEMRGTLTAIQQKSGAITGITIDTPEGTLHAETEKFILATGPFLKQSAALAGLALPLYNVLHQKIVFADSGGILPETTPFMIFRDAPAIDPTAEERAYLREHTGSENIPGNLHLRRLNTDYLIAGWAFNRQHSTAVEKPAFDPRFARLVIKGLSSFVRGMDVLVDNPPATVLHSGGYYTRSAENLPLIGATPIDGLYLIGGLSGFGIMMACGAGHLLAQSVIGQDTPAYAAALALSRYDDPDYAYNFAAQYAFSGEL